MDHSGHERKAAPGVEDKPVHSAHAPRQGGQDQHHHMLADFWQRFIVSVILTIPILLLSPMIQHALGVTLEFPGSLLLLFLLSSAVYFYGGWPFLRGIVREVSERKPGMMTLIAVAITVAYVYSSAVVFGLSGDIFFWELATLIDIMLLGHWIEMRSVLGASRALEELVRIMPAEAHLIADGGTRDVGIEDLKAGDRVLVRPGEKVPIDGAVVDGETSVNEAMLTGESRPVDKRPGDAVIGGAINGQGAVQVRVEKIGRDTYLNQVIELVRKAQESRSRAQDLADRAAFILTVVALAAGGITFAVWLVAGQELSFSVERAATVMVIACPHALGLAIPLVVAVSTSLAARSGLLIRDRSAFERAHSIEAVIFDKTGTLTRGTFGVTDIVPFAGTGEDEVLRLTASLESRSEHPIARGIAATAAERGIDLDPVEGFRSLPGLGIEGSVGGRALTVAGPGYLRETGITIADERITGVLEQGKTVVYLIEDGRPLGALALADIIRTESREAVDRLKRMGVHCMMLTGDNEHVARWVAGELGLDEYYAGVLPHEKADRVRAVQERYAVAMVGDGVNDAPALVQADVGIAIGAGTDVAVESADIVLVRNDPRDTVAIIGLSRNTYGKMVQNLLWATGYNVFAIPLAAGILFGYGILLSPAIGALLMSASTVIVAVNARLLSMPG